MVIFWIFGFMLLLWFATAAIGYNQEPYVPPQIRPTLHGDHLDQWTNLYQANCIQYQHSLVSAYSIANLTWGQYAELTGNAEWIDNPEYVAKQQEQEG